MKATPVTIPAAAAPEAAITQPVQVKVDEKPNGNLAPGPNGTFIVTDDTGRKIGFRKATARDRYRVSKMLGGEVATNQEAAGMAMIAYLCTSIDGDAIAPANSERQIETLIDRLDNDGINAIGAGLAEAYGFVEFESEETKAAIKN